MRSLIPHIICAVILLGGMLDRSAVWAQFREVHTVETVTGEQPVNLLVRWDKAEPIDGLQLRVPKDWQLTQANIQSTAGPKPDTLEVKCLGQGKSHIYRIKTSQTLRGSYQAVLQLSLGSFTGPHTWALTPFKQTDNKKDSLYAGWQHKANLTVKPSPVSADQFAVTFDGSVQERPWLKGTSKKVHLDQNGSFTLEFWMQTVELNQVMFSTWSGQETVPYPLELMVDSRGHLTYYQGVNGVHYSLTTPKPVADGQWHHVALVYKGADNWKKLFVDGQVVDSLHIETPPSTKRLFPIVMGGRGQASSRSKAVPPAYTGRLDEIRIWQKARTETQIYTGMNHQIKQAQAGLERFGFDQVDAENRLGGETSSVHFVLSNLRFIQPIKELQVVKQKHGIKVSWQSSSVVGKGFVVERSTDGQYFEEVARRPVQEEQKTRQSQRFSVTDPNVHPGVVYYRVHQLGQASKKIVTSKTVKLGVRNEHKASLELIGNFPNPFNNTTLIKYELHEQQPVQLEVWDVSGYRRATLVNKVQKAGRHDVRFNANNLPSGMYVVRLETKTTTKTHTMILMK